MDECPEILMKKLCCTCLSNDRQLFQLCRINNGINNLYWLLSSDSEAYREGFYKNTASLFICWECRAHMKRIIHFREQACAAQKELSSILDGRTDFKYFTTCFSRLSVHKPSYHTVVVDDGSDIEDNFIDCGPVDTIKSEDDDDIPLSELHNNYYESDERVEKESERDSTSVSALENCSENIPKKIKSTKLKSYKTKKKTKIKETDTDESKFYIKTEMSHEEMLNSREQRKLNVVYADSEFKCEYCIVGFKTDIDLDYHNSVIHKEKHKHVQCEICLSYVRSNKIEPHRHDHYLQYSCKLCELVCHTLTDVLKHLKTGHSIQNLVIPVERKRGMRKTPQVLRPGSKPRRNPTMRDKRTPFGYLCVECNKYFDDKDKRYKHTQRYHREGFKCETCGKSFAFRNQLNRHQITHRGPLPREECAVCHKQVRADLSRAHALTHRDRERYSCAQCDKRFVSRASYECHLKYAQAHAATDVLKYKCSMCDKGYRSRGELRDHVNYQHMNKTQHKCPVCGKALATRRCIRRHVRRAHDGVKESAKDKICQQCGKAFRDKKGLREHEFIHTGERPLSCEICGCTFRQSASLYTHRKRVHKIYPQKKHLQILDSETTL